MATKTARVMICVVAALFLTSVAAAGDIQVKGRTASETVFELTGLIE